MVTGAGRFDRLGAGAPDPAAAAQAARAAREKRKPPLRDRSRGRHPAAGGRFAMAPSGQRSYPCSGRSSMAPLVRRIIEENGVETIYHAAAFKHVPLVEHNPVVGLRNNTFGTATLADAAAACGVERFVLISTDKAVRPTSIMGASKRLAEMVLQARAAEGAGSNGVHHGALRQRARQLGLGCAPLPPPDRGGRPRDGDAPGYDPLLHVDPGSSGTGHPGGRHGHRAATCSFSTWASRSRSTIWHGR